VRLASLGNGGAAAFGASADDLWEDEGAGENGCAATREDDEDDDDSFLIHLYLLLIRI